MGMAHLNKKPGMWDAFKDMFMKTHEMDGVEAKVKIIDEGFRRAREAGVELNEKGMATNMFAKGVTWPKGFTPVDSNRVKDKGDGVCVPTFLRLAYQSLTKSLAAAQLAAWAAKDYKRWLELQRADDFSRFLSRSDVSELSN